MSERRRKLTSFNFVQQVFINNIYIITMVSVENYPNCASPRQQLWPLQGVFFFLCTCQLGATSKSVWWGRVSEALLPPLSDKQSWNPKHDGARLLVFHGGERPWFIDTSRTLSQAPGFRLNANRLLCYIITGEAECLNKPQLSAPCSTECW